MVALLRRNLAQVPPSGRAELDRDHPLAQGLLGFWRADSESPHNLVGSGFATSGWTSSGYRSGPSPIGPSWPQLGATGRLTGGQMTVPSATSLSIGWHGAVRVFTGTVANIEMIGYENTIGVPVFLRFGQTAVNVVNFVIGSSSVQGAITCPTMRPLVIVGVCSAAETTIHVNGAKDATGAANTSTDVGVGFGFSGYGNRGLDGWHGWQAVWGRPLALAESQWLTAEPYAFLTHPNAPRSYFLLNPSTAIARIARSYLGIGTSAVVSIKHDAIARVPVAGLAASTVTPTRAVAATNPVAAAPKATATPTRTALAAIHAAPTITPSASVARQVAAIVAAGGVFLGTATVTVSATARNIVAIYANKGGTAAVILGTVITAREPSLLSWTEPATIRWREPRITEATL